MFTWCASAARRCWTRCLAEKESERCLVFKNKPSTHTLFTFLRVKTRTRDCHSFTFMSDVHRHFLLFSQQLTHCNILLLSNSKGPRPRQPLLLLLPTEASILSNRSNSSTSFSPGEKKRIHSLSLIIRLRASIDYFATPFENIHFYFTLNPLCGQFTIFVSSNQAQGFYINGYCIHSSRGPGRCRLDRVRPLYCLSFLDRGGAQDCRQWHLCRRTWLRSWLVCAYRPWLV